MNDFDLNIDEIYNYLNVLINISNLVKKLMKPMINHQTNCKTKNKYLNLENNQKPLIESLNNNNIARDIIKQEVIDAGSIDQNLPFSLEKNQYTTNTRNDLINTKIKDEQFSNEKDENLQDQNQTDKNIQDENQNDDNLIDKYLKDNRSQINSIEKDKSENQFISNLDKKTKNFSRKTRLKLGKSQLLKQKQNKSNTEKFVDIKNRTTKSTLINYENEFTEQNIDSNDENLQTIVKKEIDIDPSIIKSNKIPEVYDLKKFKFKNIGIENQIGELDKIKEQSEFIFDSYKRDVKNRKQVKSINFEGNTYFVFNWLKKFIAEAQEFGDSDLFELAFWDDKKEVLTEFYISKCNQPQNNQSWVNHGIQRDTFKVNIPISSSHIVSLSVTLKFDTGIYNQTENGSSCKEKNQGWLFMFEKQNDKDVEDYLNLKVNIDYQEKKQLTQFSYLVYNTINDEFQIKTEELSLITTMQSVIKNNRLRKIINDNNVKIKNFQLKIVDNNI